MELKTFETNTKLGIEIRKGFNKMIFVEDFIDNKMLYRGKDKDEAINIYLNFKR